jgi:hypothetical protein
VALNTFQPEGVAIKEDFTLNGRTSNPRPSRVRANSAQISVSSSTRSIEFIASPNCNSELAAIPGVIRVESKILEEEWFPA